MRPEVPELSHPDEIRLRWIVNQYDGLISGVAEMDGRLVWFQVIDVMEDERRYEVFDLTEDEVSDHVARHESSVQAGGAISDCLWDADARVYRRGEARRDVDWSEHAERFPTNETLHYEGRQPLGWFKEQHLQLPLAPSGSET